MRTADGILPRDPDLKARRGTLTVVADGMGGHASGEVASQMAVEIITELYYADNGLTAPDALKFAVESANRQIYDASQTMKNTTAWVRRLSRL